jgi:hypothetical protein
MRRSSVAALVLRAAPHSPTPLPRHFRSNFRYLNGPKLDFRLGAFAFDESVIIPYLKSHAATAGRNIIGPDPGFV